MNKRLVNDFELRTDLWGAWCKTCKKMSFYGAVYRNLGWPFCQCKTLYEWVPPLNGDYVLRIWDEYPA